MKYNPNCSAGTLRIFLEQTGLGYALYNAHLLENQGLIQIDGLVGAKEIKMIHEWLEAHKEEKEE